MTIAEQIEQALAEIERDERCVICLAIESGSRAWGFESTDSDYDVRFIYVRPTDWYLSVDLNKPDVIEKPITGDLDVSGWDLRKALGLLRKSNPPLLEWLQSPIVYRQRGDVAHGLRQLAAKFYSPRATFFHYHNMAKNNRREYLSGDVVRRKKYFYVLRPLLAMRWIEQQRGLVPIEFQTLLDAIVPSGELRVAIDELLAAKRSGAELDSGPGIPVIGAFIDAELARLEDAGHSVPVAQADPGRLDAFFQDVLRTTWPR
ncbi:MAG: nucleotidyltransferase domain-containing protein [Cyanobacteria bacterium]|nr:nucleotidyltransferase domain-containing protein [Cyanobacteriota bacterium]